MEAIRLLAAVALVASAASLKAQTPAALDFDPKVGTTGTRVSITRVVPKGAQVRFGDKPVAILSEPGRRPSFIVPEGSSSSFIQVIESGRVVAKGAVPFVVSGPSIVQTPKLIGLKE